MRTDLTHDLAGVPVRGVVTIGALVEMVPEGLRWQTFCNDLDAGDFRIVRSVMRAAMKAAGDLRPIEVLAEVDRLLEEAGLVACHAFAVRLFNDAMLKAETVRKNSPAAPPQEATAAAKSD